MYYLKSVSNGVFQVSSQSAVFAEILKATVISLTLEGPCIIFCNIYIHSNEIHNVAALNVASINIQCCNIVYLVGMYIQ